jgi:hypothetical protein
MTSTIEEVDVVRVLTVGWTVVAAVGGVPAVTVEVTT